MSEDEDVAAAVSEALTTSGIQVLENAGKIDRLEPCPAGVRLTYSHDGAPGHIDATITVVAAGWVANTAELNLARRRRPNRPTRLRTGRRGASHQRAAHLRRRRRHRARDGRPRSSPRGLPRRHQRGPRHHDRPASRGQSPRQFHRPGIRLRRTHRDDGPQDSPTSSSRPSSSTPCHDRSSTDAPPAFANSSPTASATPSSAATSSENAPSNSLSWRQSRWQPT